MHPRSHLTQVLELAESGLGASAIARVTGYPRSTIRGWLAQPQARVAATAPRCERCGADAHDFTKLGDDYAYLLGVYLGDGCIAAHPRGVFKLRLMLDARYPAIIAEARAAIVSVLPGRKVGEQFRGGGFTNSAPSSQVELYAYAKSWPCLFPQHGPGRKHERPIALTEWQTAIVERHAEPLLRGLIHSDGCRFMNTGRAWRHPRYSFSNRSADIRRIFRDACERIGVRCTEAPHTVYVSRVADVAYLDRFIGPKA